MVRASYGVGVVSANQSSVLVLPIDRRRIPEAVVPLILCAGRGATAYQMLSDPYTGHFVRPIAASGRPVLCLAPGGGASWGSAAAMTVITAGRTYLGTALGVRTDLCATGGFSMGGLAALNYARLNPLEVTACLPICPAVDIVTLHGSNGTYATEIQAAYGGGAWSANSENYDPARNIHPADIPTRMWYSTNDTSALTATQETWAAANPAVQTTSLGATGHSPLAVGNEYAAFLEAQT